LLAFFPQLALPRTERTVTPAGKHGVQRMSTAMTSKHFSKPSCAIRFLRSAGNSFMLGAALSAMACEGASERAPAFEISLLVESDPGVPVSGASVASRGKTLATSQDDGRLRLALNGVEGQIVSLDVDCPDGYRPPAEPITLSLLRLTGGATAPEYRARCAPLSRPVVIAVRADNGSDLPVVYMGREVARTDGSGAAHVLLDLAPGSAFRLTLDTSANDELRPRSPSETFRVPDRNGVQVFEREFQVSKKPKPVRRRKKSAPGPRRL
jgi:hypothetical protein